MLIKHWKLTAIAVFSLSIAMALCVVALSVSNVLLLLPLSAAMEAISALVAWLCARAWIKIDPMEAVRHA